MVVSEGLLKWIMRLYPPLLFQRIWVVKFNSGYRGVQVRIRKSFLNNNYNNTIFGGTLFSAADPFYPLLFHQIFSRKGYKLMVWSKSATIRYAKPAATNLSFSINLTDNDIAHAEHVLNTEGKFIRSFPIDIYNKDGEICVSLMNEIYVRNLNFIDTTI
ncbi:MULTISPECIES: DUF4442 domain-containing protein [Mucilaginibacter]|uniref:DUF4442 domain-containing protein n=1 Tax=Mucilaginibacter rubeus TaxID=2027860 RepID=A0A5C1HZB9_9SPHI|nr:MULTISPECIES: DUF4442 domain-containing protein [Mucilaginibacter]QEM10331.1 DUF4442 domain-containing protein [Mucilaginibacter rubeus]